MTLYEQDETAWLETMSALAAERRYTDLDYANLSEYLADMAKRDRRRCSLTRSVTLICHLLKWEFQAECRSGSWQGTILEAAAHRVQLLESDPDNHAMAVLPQAYADGRKQAAAETGLARETFPPECGWDVEAPLTDRSENAGG